MKNRFYMHEFKYYDGECYVTFNIVDLNELKNEIAVNDGRIMITAGRKYQLHQEADGSRFRTRMNPVGAYLGTNIESLDLHKLGLGRQGTVLKLYGSPVQLGTASFPVFRCFNGGTVLKCEEVGQLPEDLILRYVKIILIRE